MNRSDGPPTRAYPVSLKFVRALCDYLDFDHPTEGLINTHIFHLAVVGFFFLMRPCEFLRSDSESEARKLRTQAFELRHVRLTINNTLYHGHEATILYDETQLANISDVSVMFTEQKNGWKGEVVTQRASLDPCLCPARSLGWIVRHLLLNNAEDAMPIYSHYYAPESTWRFLRYSEVTRGLRLCAAQIQSETGVAPYLISVKGLRPGGATALLCAGVDPSGISALGRWRSDAVLAYLRPQALTASQNLSAQMVTHGSYSFAPGAHMLDQLPTEASPQLHQLQAEHLRGLEAAAASYLRRRAVNQPTAVATI